MDELQEYVEHLIDTAYPFPGELKAHWCSIIRIGF